MAARLMIKFPNAVTCDETTKIKSKLPEEDFIEQPPVTLKGIADTGTIFAYSTVKYVCVCVCVLHDCRLSCFLSADWIDWRGIINMSILIWMLKL